MRCVPAWHCLYLLLRRARTSLAALTDRYCFIYIIPVHQLTNNGGRKGATITLRSVTCNTTVRHNDQLNLPSSSARKVFRWASMGITASVFRASRYCTPLWWASSRTGGCQVPWLYSARSKVQSPRNAIAGKTKQTLTLGG